MMHFFRPWLKICDFENGNHLFGTDCTLCCSFPFYDHITGLHTQKGTLIQVLPSANAYTKSAHAYIHFTKFICYLLMHVCIFIAIRAVCVHHGVRCLIAILRQNAYMHEQIT